MKPWPLFPIILLLLQPSLHGQGAEVIARKGDDALARGLWEVAELHFRRCLADPSLTPDAKSNIAVRLAESLIRAGHPDEALELLGQSFVSRNPEAPFWKAHALTGLNRFAEAVEIFSTLLADPAAPHRVESGFTRASLLLALGKPDEALDTLSGLLADADATTARQIQFYQVEILLDLNRAGDARRIMPVGGADTSPLAELLEARLQLAEGNFADAEARFRELVNHPQGQSLSRHHSAAIGLADAIQAQGNAEAAAESLLAFLQDHADSPVLESVFRKILAWLPAKPAVNDPILETLAKWITPPPVPAINRIGAGWGEGAAAWPVSAAQAELSDRLAFALYTRAIGLHRIGTPESRAESRRLLNRLRLEYPGGPLADRAIYQSARWLLDAGQADQALSLLATLRETGRSPVLKGEAAFLAATTAYSQGDPELAIRLFDEAALTLEAPEARTAKLQAAIARLRSGSTLIQQSGAPADKSLEADLELERALTTTPSSAARTAIADFLQRFPNHPRAAEARLAAAESALTGPSPDLPFARSQLDLLTDVPENLALRVALDRLRVSDLSGDSAATIAAAQAIIDAYPSDPAAAEARFTLGRNLFKSGNYYPARQVLESLATTDSNPARAQAAWLLAARSAALGGTPQSKDEALTLFEKVIEAKGSLAATAILEKSGLLIERYRLAEATATLTKWIKTLTENDPLQLPAGLLLAEALYAQGSGNPVSLVQALAVYDKLLAQAKDQPALFNRLQYLRGMTLEQLPDEKDPSKKRIGQALQAYYSVLETTTPPVEWEYFERCGFSALALLEKAGRWQAAVNIAQKIASFKGPGADVAAARASKIQLEQMIW